MQLLRRTSAPPTFSRQAKAIAAAGIVAAIALAACSSGATVAPKQAVSQSFSSVGDQSGITLKFSLGLSPNQISQLANRNGGHGIPAQTAQALSQAAIVFSLQTGGGEPLNSKQAAKDASNRFSLGIQSGSTMPLEVRYVDQTLYARADVKQLVSDFGGNPSTAAEFQAALQKANQYVPGLAAFGAGNWVSVSKASIEPLLGLLKQYEKSAQNQAGQPAAAQNQASVQTLVNDIENAFHNNSTYTYVGGGVYNVSVQLQTLIRQVGSALQSYVATIPGASTKISNADIAKVASQAPSKATVQVHVQNGKAQEVSLDVNQFVAAKDKAPFPVPITMQISEPGTISAPSPATPLDLSKISQLLGGQASRANSSAA